MVLIDTFKFLATTSILVWVPLKLNFLRVQNHRRIDTFVVNLSCKWIWFYFHVIQYIFIGFEKRNREFVYNIGKGVFTVSSVFWSVLDLSTTIKFKMDKNVKAKTNRFSIVFGLIDVLKYTKRLLLIQK
jgi:hypothetical protein